ncbi:arrestin domain-containing protein 3-like [Oppia nitens]|uniref:arrestin domain-containing protein 3-like n=1 Tax=Oppia nitens TaxID=1686743 RepID=UPI0023DA8242|nr:arrestin domain-containing protein 3-like [Oppia nitens]
MDYIQQFDIRLEREMYYAGETLTGHVILDTNENFKLKAIRVLLRGKAHSEWKVVVSGERRTVKDDQVFVDERTTIWDKGEGLSILPRGHHSFPFKFHLPESCLPCSFEAKPCTVRYYVKVTIDIPYASPPQGMKYFTIIGPHIDCMDEQYLKPLIGSDRRSICCLCCQRGVVSLKTLVERTAYCCGESIRLKADIDNQSEENVRLKLKLVQYVEFYIERGVLGLNKEVNHTVLEYRGDCIQPFQKWRFESSNSFVVPVMPPTLVGICRLLQIYYVLKVWVEMEKSGDDLHMNFPLTIATCPFRIPNSNQQPIIDYDVCCDHVEGGLYIGPEFQLGQVYDGSLGMDNGETVVLYRPVYVCVRKNDTESVNESYESKHMPVPSAGPSCSLTNSC